MLIISHVRLLPRSCLTMQSHNGRTAPHSFPIRFFRRTNQGPVRLPGRAAFPQSHDAIRQTACPPSRCFALNGSPPYNPQSTIRNPHFLRRTASLPFRQFGLIWACPAKRVPMPARTTRRPFGPFGISSPSGTVRHASFFRRWTTPLETWAWGKPP